MVGTCRPYSRPMEEGRYDHRAQKNETLSLHSGCSHSDGILHTAKQVGNFDCLNCPAEKETLSKWAPVLDEQQSLFLGFDTLRDDIDRKAFRKIDDRTDNCQHFGVAGHSIDK